MATARPGSPPVDASTELEQLELASVDYAEILIELEHLVGCELDPDSIATARTVGDLCRVRPAPSVF